MFPEILLSLIPMLPSYWAWRFSRQSDSADKRRAVLFNAGLLGSFIASLLIIGSWLQPFPLSSVAGGFSNGRNDLLSLVAFIAAVLVAALAVFGKARSRLLLLLSGLLLVMLSIAAFMSNNR